MCSLRTMTTGAWGTLARQRRLADLDGGCTAKTHGWPTIYVGWLVAHCSQ
jgi:hypothetical protein